MRVEGRTVCVVEGMNIHTCMLVIKLGGETMKKEGEI